MATHLTYDVLSRLVERHAEPAEEARARRHLTSCGRCRSELAWLERIRGLPQRTGTDDDRAGMQDGPSDGWGNTARPGSGVRRAGDSPGHNVTSSWSHGTPS